MNSPAELNNSPFANAGQPTAPGEILRNARVAAGIGQREIANDLYLTLCYVEALEKGEYDKLPGETFIRGYLRSYAQRLGMSEKRILSAYDATVHPEMGTERRHRMTTGVQALDIEEDADSGGGALRWIIGLVVVVGLGIGGYYLYQWQAAQDVARFPAQSPGAVSAPGAPAVEPAAKDSPVTVAAPSPPGTEAKPDESAADADGGAAGAATAASVPETVDSRETGTPPSVSGANYLVILFSEDCWIKVVGDGGKTLVSRLKRAGDVLEMTGRPPFSLRIGNASGVMVTYNGQPVDLRPHTENNVANLVLN